MRKILFAAAMLFCFSAHSQECEVTNPSVESVSEYLSVIGGSLAMVKAHFNAYERVQKKKDKDGADALYIMKDLKEGFICAATMVGIYKKSKNKEISESSDALAKGYQDMAGFFDGLIVGAKAAMDGKEASPGEVADKLSDGILNSKKAWTKIMFAIEQGTTAVTEKVDPKTNKVRRYGINEAERDSIVKELKSHFKLPMKGEPEGIDVIAGQYYDLLMKFKYTDK